MTPKEARSIIRYEILTLKAGQIEAKKALGQPHGAYSDLRGIPALMSESNRRAAALTTFHNALNELCGRKPSHNYKEGYRSHYVANEIIKRIKSEIVWPEKSQATA